MGRAWKDVNFHLELRKQILDLNVRYHERANDFFDKMNELEASCTDALVPVEREAVKNFLTKIHEQRRALLEALNSALQAGNLLIGKLKELGAEGTLDSRPDRIRTSVNRGDTLANSYVQFLLRKCVVNCSNWTGTELDGRVAREEADSRSHLPAEEDAARAVPRVGHPGGRPEAT